MGREISPNFPSTSLATPLDVEDLIGPEASLAVGVQRQVQRGHIGSIDHPLPLNPLPKVKESEWSTYFSSVNTWTIDVKQ